MPQLPIYNSQRNIEARGAPMRNEAAAPFQIAQGAVGVIQQMAQQWSDANDVMQYTNAKANHEVATAEIETIAAADPDFKNSKKYAEDLQKAKAKSVEGISNAAVRNKASAEFDYSGKISAIKIDSQFKKKQLEYNKIQTKNAIEALQQKKISARTTAEKMQYDEDIKELLQLNVASGTLSYEEAEKNLADSQKTGVQYEIYSDSATEENESRVLEELRKENGEYKYLDTKTRLGLIRESQDRIFQNNQTLKREIKEETETRTNNLITDIANKNVDLRRIDEEFSLPEELGGINRETLNNFKKVVVSGNVDTLKRITKDGIAKDYYKAFDSIISQEDRIRAKELIVKAWADKNLSLEEGAYLDSVLKETGKANALGLSVRKVWRGILGYKGSEEKDAGLSLHELIKRVSNGIDPQIAAKQILTEEAVKRNPYLADVTEAGSTFMAEDGTLHTLTLKDGFIESVFMLKGKE